MVRKQFGLVMILLTALGSTAFTQTEVYFSFASDDHHDGPTFDGNSDFINGVAVVDLMVDTNNDSNGGQISFLADFLFGAQIKDHLVISCGSGWLHIWKIVWARADFIEVNGAAFNPLLTIGVNEAVLTSLSPSRSTVGQTMTFEASASVDPNLGIFPQTLLAAVLGVNNLAKSQDLAFTFTHVRTATNALVPLTSNGHFAEPWTSEGSFSASGSP